MSTDRCNYCGFPMDTPNRAHDFIHQQGEALIEHRKEMRRLSDIALERGEALERARGCIKGLLARTPVRDVEETLAEIDAALRGPEGGLTGE